MMILRGGGVTLFPYHDLRGAVENFQRKLHRAWGGGGSNHFFPEKEKEMKILLGAFMVDTIYSPAQTGAPQLSGDDITDKMDLLVSKCKKTQDCLMLSKS